MKLSDFILLDAEEKKQAVLHMGVLIAKRTDYDSIVFLFQLPHYYVETYCNTDSKVIEEYRIFHEVDQLTPYLNAIPIGGLIR